MPRIDALVDIYIDANLILLIAYLIWVGSQVVLRRSRLADDFGLRLRLGEGLILAALISPAIALAVTHGLSALFPGLSLNAADLALAQFLDGRVAMSAERFSVLMQGRDTLVGEIARPSGWLSQLIVSAFILGLIGSLIRLTVAVRDLRRILAGSYLVRRTAVVDVRISDDISIPFSARGLVRRHVVLPSEMLATPAEIQVAIAHELQHIRRGDTEWELALSLLRPVFFWHPAFHRWKQDIDRIREMHCDRAVLGRGRIAARDYAECLLSVCNRRLARAEVGMRGTMAVVPFIDRRSVRRGRRATDALGQRIAAIARPPAGAARTRVLWPLLGVAAFGIAMGAATLQRPGDWSQDRLMLSAIVNLERLESHNRGLGAAGF